MLTQISYSTLDADLRARLDAIALLSSGSTNNQSFTVNADALDNTLIGTNNTQLIFTGDTNAGRISWNSVTQRLQFSNDNITFHNLIESSGVINGTGIAVTQTGSPAQYQISVDGTVLTTSHSSESAETVHGGLVNNITLLDGADVPKLPGLAKGTLYFKDGSGITITQNQVSPINHVLTFNSTGVSGIKSSTEVSYLTGNLNITNNSAGTGIAVTHVSPTEIQLQSQAVATNSVQKSPGVIDFVDSVTVKVGNPTGTSVDFTAANIDVNTSGTPLVGVADFQDSTSIEVQNPSANIIQLLSKAVRVNGVDLTPGQVNLIDSGSVTISNTGNDIEFTSTGTASIQVNSAPAIVGLTNLIDSGDVQVNQVGNDVSFTLLTGGGSTILGGRILLVDPVHPDAVDDTNTDTPFVTITQAISQSVSGDSIWVAPATYTENVTISNKNITLKSTGSSTQSSTAAASVVGNFEVTESIVALESLHLQSSTVTETLNVNDAAATATAVTLRNCSITNTNASGAASTIDGSLTNVTLFDCLITNSIEVLNSSTIRVNQSTLNYGPNSSQICLDVNSSSSEVFNSQLAGEILLTSTVTTAPLFNDCRISGHILLTDVSVPTRPAQFNQCLINSSADGFQTIRGLDTVGGSFVRLINTEINSGTAEYVGKEGTGALVVEYSNLTLSGSATSVETGVVLTHLSNEAFEHIYLRQTSGGAVGEIRFKELDANGSSYVGFKAPTAISSSEVWELPAVDGSPGQVLSTNGSNVLSWTTPSSFTWTEIGSSQTAVPNNGYVVNSGSLAVITLPAVAAVGSIIEVVGKSASGWQIAQQVSQQIYFGSATTTNGAGGYLESTHRRDTVRLICTVANTEFTVMSAVGNLTVI